MAKKDMIPDAFTGYYEEEVYTKGLTREETIENQIRYVVNNYSKGNWDDFEYSVKALISILPFDIRDKIKIPEHNTSTTGIEEHYKLFTDIQTFLEKETNLIFRKKFIKSFE